MSEAWENEQHPGQAEVHEPIIKDEVYWEHEMKGEEGEEDMLNDLDATYIWLDQLREDLIEVGAEYDPSEEIDRGHMKQLLNDLDAVARVIDLMKQHEDPRG